MWRSVVYIESGGWPLFPNSGGKPDNRNVFLAEGAGLVRIDNWFHQP